MLSPFTEMSTVVIRRAQLARRRWAMNSKNAARWKKFIHDDLTSARTRLWGRPETGAVRAFLTKRIAEDEAILARLRQEQSAATMAGPRAARLQLERA
jgi:hypothetical protein